MARPPMFADAAEDEGATGATGGTGDTEQAAVDAADSFGAALKSGDGQQILDAYRALRELAE